MNPFDNIQGTAMRVTRYGKGRVELELKKPVSLEALIACCNRHAALPIDIGGPNLPKEAP